MSRDRWKGYFSLYKGEREEAFGTIEEIAKKLGIKESAVKYYFYPSYQKKFKKGANVRILIKVEE